MESKDIINKIVEDLNLILEINGNAIKTILLTSDSDELSPRMFEVIASLQSQQLTIIKLLAKVDIANE